MVYYSWCIMYGYNLTKVIGKRYNVNGVKRTTYNLTEVIGITHSLPIVTNNMCDFCAVIGKMCRFFYYLLCNNTPPPPTQKLLCTRRPLRVPYQTSPASWFRRYRYHPPPPLACSGFSDFGSKETEGSVIEDRPSTEPDTVKGMTHLAPLWADGPGPDGILQRLLHLAVLQVCRRPVGVQDVVLWVQLDGVGVQLDGSSGMVKTQGLA